MKPSRCWRARVPDFESVWIDGDTELESRYGERVPVLRDDASDRELGWPFDANALQSFIASLPRDQCDSSHCTA